jgi:hypothetical protein
MKLNFHSRWNPISYYLQDIKEGETIFCKIFIAVRPILIALMYWCFPVFVPGQDSGDNLFAIVLIPLLFCLGLLVSVLFTMVVSAVILVSARVIKGKQYAARLDERW